MKQFTIALACCVSSLACAGQTLVEAGFFPYNGLFACTGFEHYLLTGAGHLIDVTDPYSPQLTGNAGIGLGSSVIVDGDRAYFGMGMQAEVRVVDLSFPSAPLVVGNVPLPSSAGVFGLAIAGDVLFAANAQGGLVSIDVSAPQAPDIIQTLPIPVGSQSRGVAVLGDHAYVANGTGLKVVDVSDPSDMQMLSTIGSHYVSVSITSDGTKLAAGLIGGGAHVFDLTDPTLPVLLFGIPESNGPAHCVQLHGDRLLVSSEQFGVRIYILGTSSATLLGSFDNSANGQTFSAYAMGELVFVTGLVQGATILQWGTTGITDHSRAHPGILYPVPVKGTLNWTAGPVDGYDAYRILDGTGRVIQEGRATGTSIDVAALPSGTYVLHALKRGGVLSTASFVHE